MKYFRTKDGRIMSLSEFKYDKKRYWFRPKQKYLKRVNLEFTWWRWCFDDEYHLIPDVLGKVMIERIKREECKFADTIEELCDKLVLSGIDIIILNKKHTRYRFEGSDEWFDITETELKRGVYGAIWTDKGLTYVAKMNNKGKWELL